MNDFDVIVYGASGFTGRLVAEYLQECAPAGLAWAVAGRNPQKLSSVLAEIGADVPVIVADSGDAQSLQRMAERTRVVCTTVGPYTKYGTPVVEACVNAGASYCDLTGEPNFIHDNISKFEARAQSSGARIVHCCGFDSIPSDLGTFLLAEHFRSKNTALRRARLRVAGSRGGFSGGTIASMFEIMKVAKDPEVRRVLADPYSLIPKGAPRGQDINDPLKATKDEDLGEWTAPFIMATINTKVVRRSAAMLGYGEHFSYEERFTTGSGAGGAVAAAGVCLALKAFMGTAQLPGFGGLYRRMLPGPGEGPSKKQRENGFFKMYIHGEGENGQRAKATIIGQRDPGYGETSRMLAESALCLAKDELPKRGGILTPAVSMGDSLVRRLRAAGMTFEASEENSDGPTD